jgi:hypothetical protein
VSSIRTGETVPVQEVVGRRHRSQEDVVLLARASALVSSGWCQRGLAQDRDGRQVEPWSDAARSWSPLGALLRAWYEHPDAGHESFAAAYAALALATGGRVEEWNAARWRALHHLQNAFARADECLPVARRQVRTRRGA